MVYIIEMWCDGACRNNGGYNPNKPIFAGAGVYYPRGKPVLRRQYRPLPHAAKRGNKTATNNRAEIEAVILALETALQVKEALVNDPWVSVRINTDSEYVRDAMMSWSSEWQENGWRNAKGGPVANQDLFRKALRLERQILDFKAHIAYIHVYREDNEEANELANKACDVAERQYYGSDSGYDSDY
ncbi:ribonuclease H-like protein [Cystobasidium minutum MCA 4210]|uniref:ribonuclease H-like protein n=1 Tax=Cystobasidium minutum MCA 4210 TaxID=1397322 RepID=UPI0034CE6939|eukprot:jgi/Rhomi1/196308/gm1.4522_g